MQIIDFHTHIYPETIARKAAQSICDFYELDGGGMCGTVSQLLERGKQAGISRYVVLPVGLKPNHVRHINEFILSEAERHPEFTGFGTVHAGQEDLLEETQFILDSGLHGIKMHPDTQLFNIDDERLFPMYDLLQDKIPVMLHMGDKRYSYSHPARLRRVMQQFPRLQVIAAHFGGYSVYDEAYENLHDMNCMMDVSSSLMFMSREEAVKRIRSYGAERLLYGTDFPLWDPVTEVARFQALPLTEAEFDLISHKNALAILGK
ncbi:MAG: amidohydrolase [Oscillospiraceae bacterium]|nr:amidohydrolase [Oscillospiraceae bacterium]